MDSFLVLRGIKTLHLRMQRHCENGEKIAHFLVNHSLIDKVYWPGFKTHTNHEVAKKQMTGFGGMISFTLVGDDLEMAKKVVSNTELFTLAESFKVAPDVVNAGPAGPAVATVITVASPSFTVTVFLLVVTLTEVIKMNNPLT